MHYIINENYIKNIRQEASAFKEAILEMETSTSEFLSVTNEGNKITAPYILMLEEKLCEILAELKKMIEPAECISDTLNKVADVYEEIWFGISKIE